MLDLEIDFSPLVQAIEEAERRVPDLLKSALEQQMIDAADKAKATTAFVDHTGRLRAEISAEVTGDFFSGSLTGRVFAPTPYAIYVEEGTAAHRIEIKRTTGRPLYLRFNAGGQPIYRKVVNHPGIRARHFLRDSVDLDKISEAIETAIVNALCR